MAAVTLAWTSCWWHFRVVVVHRWRLCMMVVVVVVVVVVLLRLRVIRTCSEGRHIQSVWLRVYIHPLHSGRQSTRLLLVVIVFPSPTALGPPVGRILASCPASSAAAVHHNTAAAATVAMVMVITGRHFVLVVIEHHLVAVIVAALHILHHHLTATHILHVLRWLMLMRWLVGHLRMVHLRMANHLTHHHSVLVQHQTSCRGLVLITGHVVALARGRRRLA